MRKLVKTVVPLKVGKVFEFPCNRFLDWHVAGRQVVIRCLNWTEGEPAPCKWIVIEDGGTIPDGYGFAAKLCGSVGRAYMLVSTCIGNV